MSKETHPSRKRITNERPVSLYPLSFKEAVSALLKVKPKPKEEPKEQEEQRQEKPSD
jgi:hypothetical protein